jgi:hypothetical protein
MNTQIPQVDTLSTHVSRFLPEATDALNGRVFRVDFEKYTRSGSKLRRKDRGVRIVEAIDGQWIEAVVGGYDTKTGVFHTSIEFDSSLRGDARAISIVCRSALRELGILSGRVKS